MEAKFDLEATLERLKLDTELAASKARAEVFEQYDNDKLPQPRLDPSAVEFQPRNITNELNSVHPLAPS